jgi:hypothetical protein
MHGLQFYISEGRKLMNYNIRLHFIGVHIWQKVLINTYSIILFIHESSDVIILENAMKCKDAVGSELHNLWPKKE